MSDSFLCVHALRVLRPIFLVYHSAIIKITAALVLTDIVAWAYPSPIVLSVIRMGTLTIVIAPVSRRERSVPSAATTSPASSLLGLAGTSTSTPLPILLRLLLQCGLLLTLNRCRRPPFFGSRGFGSMTDGLRSAKILNEEGGRIRGRIEPLHIRTSAFTRGGSGVPLLDC